jgi:hypothetical protein
MAIVAAAPPWRKKKSSTHSAAALRFTLATLGCCEFPHDHTINTPKSVGHIAAEVTHGERTFRLRVRDDGCGIPPEILEEGRPGHFGLPSYE